MPGGERERSLPGHSMPRSASAGGCAPVEVVAVVAVETSPAGPGALADSVLFLDWHGDGRGYGRHDYTGSPTV